MVVLLVLSIILLFLTVDYVVQRTEARRAALAAKAFPVAVDLTLPGSPRPKRAWGLDELPDNTFLSKGHVWLRREPSGTVVVGVDPMLVSLLGGVQHAYTLDAGNEVTSGGPLAMLRRGARALKIRSPVTGHITDVNQQALDSPECVAEDPFYDGWIYRIEPESLFDSLQETFVGNDGALFLRREVTRLRDLIEELTSRQDSPLPLAADGGMPVGSLADHIDDQAWEELIARFFTGDEKSEGSLVTFRPAGSPSEA
jgi:glycine cleavage system H protein